MKPSKRVGKNMQLQKVEALMNNTINTNPK